jgi:predicted DCC family thiol-disulfide oxidoreductase YuxK
MNNHQFEIDVFYDGGCPVCRMEVSWYRRADTAGRISWIDIVELHDQSLPAGKTREELLNRFHVRDSAGNWHVGVAAFARIWDEMARFRRFSVLFRLPVTRHAAEVGYRLFLAWQRRHRAGRATEPACEAG